MSTNAEKLVKIVLALANILSGICRFLLSLPRRCICCPRYISWVNGLILIKFAQDAATATRFGTQAFEIKVILPILPKIGCHSSFNVP